MSHLILMTTHPGLTRTCHGHAFLIAGFLARRLTPFEVLETSGRSSRRLQAGTSSQDQILKIGAASTRYRTLKALSEFTHVGVEDLSEQIGAGGRHDTYAIFFYDPITRMHKLINQPTNLCIEFKRLVREGCLPRSDHHPTTVTPNSPGHLDNVALPFGVQETNAVVHRNQSATPRQFQGISSENGECGVDIAPACGVRADYTAKYHAASRKTRSGTFQFQPSNGRPTGANPN